MPSSSSLSLNIRTSSTGVLLGLTCRAEHDCVASAASAASAIGPATADFPSTDHLGQVPVQSRRFASRVCPKTGAATRRRRTRSRKVHPSPNSQRTATAYAEWSMVWSLLPVSIPLASGPYECPVLYTRLRLRLRPGGQSSIHSCVSIDNRDPGRQQARKAWMVEDVWNGLFAHRVDPVGRESRRDAPKLVRCQSLPEQAIDAPAVGEVGSRGGFEA